MKKQAKASVKSQDRPLDQRETQFVAEYLIDLDVERAALAAGYSRSMAHSKCFQWVSSGKTKPHVYAAVKREMDKRAARTGVTQDRVLKELARLAFSDTRKFYRPDGTLKPISELDDDTAAALAGVEVVLVPGNDEPQYVKKIKLWDKKGGLELAMRHLGMLKEAPAIHTVTVVVRDFTGKGSGAG